MNVRVSTQSALNFTDLSINGMIDSLTMLETNKHTH